MPALRTYVVTRTFTEEVMAVSAGKAAEETWVELPQDRKIEMTELNVKVA